MAITTIGGAIAWEGHLPMHLTTGSNAVGGDGSVVMWRSGSDGPFIGNDGVMVAADGRIDNLQELSEIADTVSNRESPNAVLWALYRKFGSAAYERVIGDFAIAVLDPSNRVLHLARDSFGARPLYYCQQGRLLVWSSHLNVLLDITGVKPDPSDEYVAAFLTTTEDLELTPYREVFKVRPGAILTVTESRRTLRVWDRPLPATLRLKDDREYELEFLRLLENAICCSVRDGRAAVVELSGGLDSSSIACVASRLMATGRMAASRLELASYVYPGSPTADESRYINSVEEAIGASSHRIDDPTILASLWTTRVPVVPNPTWLFDATYAALADVALQSGPSVILSGQGGDHLLMHEPDNHMALADMLVGGELRAFLATLRALQRARKWSYAQLLWTNVALPLGPESLKRESAEATLPPWLRPDFVTRSRVADRARVLPKGSQRRSFAQQRQATLLDAAVSITSTNYYRDRLGVDVAYPYLHRPLVDFLLSLPIGQKQRPAESRSIQRRALTDILPEMVRTRTNKRGPGEPLCRAVIREWPQVHELASRPAVVDRGYVDQREFLTALERVRNGITDSVLPLVRTLTLEMWLRRIGCSDRRHEPERLLNVRVSRSGALVLGALSRRESSRWPRVSSTGGEGANIFTTNMGELDEIRITARRDNR